MRSSKDAKISATAKIFRSYTPTTSWIIPRRVPPTSSLQPTPQTLAQRKKIAEKSRERERKLTPHSFYGVRNITRKREPRPLTEQITPKKSSPASVRPPQSKLTPRRHRRHCRRHVAVVSPNVQQPRNFVGERRISK